ncbi:MAG: tetratricopeptide repeat protein [Bacteroidota bacterium]
MFPKIKYNFLKTLINGTFCLMIISLLSCMGEDQDEKKPKEKKAKKTVTFVKNDPRQFFKKSASDLNEKALKEISRENLPQAKELFEKSLKVEPNNPVTLNNLALIAKKENDFDLASYYFLQAMQIDSTYFSSFINYSLMLFENDYLSKSIDINKHVISKCKDEELLGICHLHNSIAQFSLRDCGSAKESFEQASLYLENNAKFTQKLKDLKKYLEACK